MNEQTSPKRRRVTIVDVAQAAGVSAGTVSNALSGKRKVDAETRKRIEAAIQTLGYRPNLAARGMRSGRTNTIAIFSSMPVAVAAGPSKLGFLMEIAASAAVSALERNTALILVPPAANPSDALETIAMDGAVVVEPERDDPVLSHLARVGIPTVCIGEPLGVPGAYVDLDYRAMADMLIAHLFETGATRFPLVVGASARPSNLAFKAAYQAACAARGMDAAIFDVPEHRAEVGGTEVVAGLIAQGTAFDAVLVPTDAMASGVMEALRSAGLQVPRDVRVVTRYDGFRARTEEPPLTAINLKLDTVAALATEALAAIIEGETRDGALPAPAPELIVRNSSMRRT